MDQNKNTEGQQGQDQQDTQSQPTRDQAEGSRDKSRSQSEKNRSGISNRGMSPDEEQLDLPSRGSSDDDFQSER
jgi:hypothetical protein